MQSAEKTVVIGAAGVVGSTVVRRLREAGHEVCSVDITRVDRLGADIDLVINPDWLDDPRLLAERIGSATAVVNFAGSGDAAWCNSHPDESLRLNVRSARAGVALSSILGVRRSILASTCEVYGPHSGQVTEDVPCRPLTHYGASKVATEVFALVDAANENLELNVLRLGSAYGSSMRPTGLVTAIITSIREKTPITLAQNPGRRQFTSLDDVAEVVSRCLIRTDVVPSVLNVCSPQSTPVIDLVTWAVETFGMPTPNRGSEMPQPASIEISAEGLERAIGYVCAGDVREYITDLVVG